MLLVFCSCDLICVACVWYLPRFRFVCLVASTVVTAGWLVFSLVDICGFAGLPVDLFDLVGIVLLVDTLVCVVSVLLFGYVDGFLVGLDGLLFGCGLELVL